MTTIIANRRRGRPPKPKPSNEPTIGEALEDVCDALRSLHQAFAVVVLRMDRLREIISAERARVALMKEVSRG